jgi:hypothetical protein
VQLNNNFSSGPDGTNISVLNSGNGDDDAFDTFNRGTGTVNQYKQADLFNRATAEFVLRVNTTTTITTAHVAWQAASIGTQNEIYIRFYCYFTVLPDNFGSSVIFRVMGAATTVDTIVIVCNSGGDKSLAFTNMTGTWEARTTSSMVANAWMRVEARIQHSATTGNGEMRFYADADADTDSPTETVTFTNQNLARNDCDTTFFGYAKAMSGLEDMYMSGLEVNNTGWPGPLPFKQKASPGYQPNAVAIHNDVF